MTKKLKAIVVAHGGGFCKEHKEADLYFSAILADQTSYEVWDLDYKLTPKNPYPAAFDQVYNLVKFAYQNAKKLNFERNNLILVGNSAGGNLLTAAVLKAGQTHEFKVKLLIIPIIHH